MPGERFFNSRALALPGTPISRFVQTAQRSGRVAGSYWSAERSGEMYLRSGKRLRTPAPYGRSTRRRLFPSRTRFRGVQRQRRGIRSGQGVTDHYDRTTVYRRRPMPRFRRKRWVRFVKKVQAASEKTLGTKTVVLNNSATQEIDYLVSAGVNQNLQIVGYACLYGVDSASGSSGDGYLGSKDLQSIYSGASSQGPTVAMRFKSAVLDLTFVNRNYGTDGETAEPWEEGLEVDVYEITVKRTLSYETNPLGLLGAFTQAATDTTAIASYTSIPGLTERGVTPFDFPQAMSQYGIRIWKKTKFRIAYGQSFTYQVRDPRDHTLNKGRMDDILGVNWPGLTRYVLWVAKPLAGFTLAPGFNVAAWTNVFGRLTIGATRKYSYVYNDASQKQDGYVTL